MANAEWPSLVSRVLYAFLGISGCSGRIEEIRINADVQRARSSIFCKYDLEPARSQRNQIQFAAIAKEVYTYCDASLTIARIVMAMQNASNEYPARHSPEDAPPIRATGTICGASHLSYR